MSGYADTTVMRNGNFGPVSSFLQKPFSPAVLGRKVREMLDHMEAAPRKPATQ
jgi:hypothetical protein